MQKVVLFYNGLDVLTRQILYSKGVIPSKTAADAKVQRIENEAKTVIFRGRGFDSRCGALFSIYQMAGSKLGLVRSGGSGLARWLVWDAENDWLFIIEDCHESH
ncbi:hypothetical protein Tco_0299288 [Tanacetum coccineum]